MYCVLGYTLFSIPPGKFVYQCLGLFYFFLYPPVLHFLISLDFFSNNSKKPNMDPGLVCRICELQADGTHFGVVTCRACAVFFRFLLIY